MRTVDLRDIEKAEAVATLRRLIDDDWCDEIPATWIEVDLDGTQVRIALHTTQQVMTWLVEMIDRVVNNEFLDDEAKSGDCNVDCDPGGNSEDHRAHSTHASCGVCQYHEEGR